MNDATSDQSADAVVELLKSRIDRTMIRENLRKSHDERLFALESIIVFIQQLHSPGSHPATTQFKALLTALRENDVSFVIVGGVAAALHGAARITYDLDIVYDRSFENLQSLIAALAPLKAYPRDAPPGLPFRLNEETLKRGLNFKFATAKGAIDLMGELAGVGSFPVVLTHATRADVSGKPYLFLDLDTLIVARRVAGRMKDLEAIAELEAIREERVGAS
ncbi:MAG TPA: hypothetical protein VGQ65_11875 [Thermoanaerobaculia bacterium]|jgi:hypothetical protein|nr:hypothetical protein [Thermoanaerobaculia bacterium]